MTTARQTLRSRFLCWLYFKVRDEGEEAPKSIMFVKWCVRQ